MKRIMSKFYPAMAVAALCLGLIFAGSCECIAPVRTLPSWVRGIYIPMFKNKTYEPEVEELATRLTQEAFIHDGRVDVVPKSVADLMLVAEIVDWQGISNDESGDNIAFTTNMTVTATVKLFEPFDLASPVADLGVVKASTTFDVDTRSVGYIQEPDQRKALFQQLADRILSQVITGFPANLRDLPPGVTLPQVRTPQSISAEDVLSPRPNTDLSIH